MSDPVTSISAPEASCANCVYVDLNYDKTTNELVPECHRWPPTPGLVQPSDMPGAGLYGDVHRYPRVGPRDWCGEYIFRHEAELNPLPDRTSTIAPVLQLVPGKDDAS